MDRYYFITVIITCILTWLWCLTIQQEHGNGWGSTNRIRLCSKLLRKVNKLHSWRGSRHRLGMFYILFKRLLIIISFCNVLNREVYDFAVLSHATCIEIAILHCHLNMYKDSDFAFQIYDEIFILDGLSKWLSISSWGFEVLSFQNW